MSKSNTINLIIAAGALNAFIAVAAGAFAAHALKNTFTPEQLNTFRTAANYQMYHALGLLIIGVLNKYENNRRNFTVAILMFTGIVLFSGSLYLLAFTGLRWLGMITPFGGVLLLVAWITLGFNYLLKKE
jgi:uncharacterized membrane protein YgdD (TMEM256/DUF423 family)